MTLIFSNNTSRFILESAYLETKILFYDVKYLLKGVDCYL